MRSSIQVFARCVPPCRWPRRHVNHGSTFKGMSEILPALAKSHSNYAPLGFVFHFTKQKGQPSGKG